MEQDQGIPVDPRAAFEHLQQYHGMEMARLAGDIAAKNTYISMLSQELKAAQEHITALEQNQAEGNGKATPSGADLRNMEMHPSVPPALRKVKDNPQA